MQKEYVIPIFLPYLDNKNRYTYYYNIKSDKQKKITVKEIKETINKYLKNFKDESKYVEVAFWGENFLKIKDYEKYLETVYEYIKEKKVNRIKITTTPDCINKEVIKKLKKYGVKTIELDVKSTNDYILKKCMCNNTIETIKNACKLIRWNGLMLGIQMLIGLPESTRLDDMNTAKEIIKLKPKLVRIEPVLVLKDTILEQEFKQKEYIPLTVEQAVERCKEIVDLFNKKKINMIRIGFQNPDEIVEKIKDSDEVVAGPYHPAFRKIVESKLWYDAIVEKIKKVNAKVRQVKITANPENVNSIIGEKNENIVKLKDIYEVDTLIETSEEVKPGDFRLDVEQVY